MTDGEAIADDSTSTLRRGVYWILIALAAGNMLGRLMAIDSVDSRRLDSYRISEHLKRERAKLTAEGLAPEAIEARITELRPRVELRYHTQRPFLSGNDRSRWCTVRALVEHGTYSIDDVTLQPGWDTIDMVKHADREGTERLYSSKPTLLPTLMAGPYWLIHKLTGKTLGSHPYEIGKLMLVLINVVPMLVMLALVARLADRWGESDWSRIFVVAAASLKSSSSATCMAFLMAESSFGSFCL